MKKILLVIAMGLLMLTMLSAKEMKDYTEIVIDPNPMDNYTNITVSFSSPVEVQISIETESGKVIKKNICTEDAPSTLAASYGSSGKD